MTKKKTKATGTENPQANTRKSNPTSKIDTTLCLSGIYPKNSGSFTLQEKKNQCNSLSQQIKRKQLWYDYAS